MPEFQVTLNERITADTYEEARAQMAGLLSSGGLIDCTLAPVDALPVWPAERRLAYRLWQVRYNEVGHQTFDMLAQFVISVLELEFTGYTVMDLRDELDWAIRDAGPRPLADDFAFRAWCEGITDTVVRALRVAQAEHTGGT